MITPVNAIWMVMALCLLWGLYRLQRKRNNHYDATDMLMGPDGKASLTNHIVLGMALMFAWVCIDRSNDGKDVDNLVLGGLAIFILRQVAGQGITAFKQSQDDEPDKPKRRR